MKEPSGDETASIWSVVTRAGLAAWSIVGLFALVAIGVWLVLKAEILIAPLVLAAALIYILNPLVRRLAGMGVPRVLGGAIAFLLLIAVVSLVGFLVVPRVSDQAADFGGDFPSLYQSMETQIEDLAESVGATIDLPSYSAFQDILSDPDSQDRLLRALGDRLGAITSGLLEAILVFFVAPVIAYYVMVDLPRIREEMLMLVPESNREEVVHVGRSLGRAIGGFIRGQALVAFIVGVMTSIGYAAIGLQFWLIVGMVAGLLNIIPFVGPWVGGGLGFMIAIATTSDLKSGLAAGLVALVVQQIDNNFVSPTVLRATVRLQPAVVILVLILGGSVGGLWGVLLAVPVTATIKIVAGHLWRTRLLGQSWAEASEALIQEPEKRSTVLSKLRNAGDRDVESTGGLESGGTGPSNHESVSTEPPASTDIDSSQT